jgi:PAS domain S-box-containing protein
MSSNPTNLDPELLEQFLGALTMMTPEGRIISWNRGAEVLYGYSAEEALAGPSSTSSSLRTVPRRRGIKSRRRS